MTAYQERGIIDIGRHRLWYEDPGIAVLVYDGKMDVDEMRILCDVPDVEEHGEAFQLTLCDVRKFGGLDTAARKLGSQRIRKAAMYYTAYVGANFSMKALVSMWVRATNILQGPKNEAAFFDDMETAKKWLTAKHDAHPRNASK